MIARWRQGNRPAAFSDRSWKFSEDTPPCRCAAVLMAQQPTRRRQRPSDISILVAAQTTLHACSIFLCCRKALLQKSHPSWLYLAPDLQFHLRRGDHLAGPAGPSPQFFPFTQLRHCPMSVYARCLTSKSPNACAAMHTSSHLLRLTERSQYARFSAPQPNISKSPPIASPSTD